MSIYAFEKLDVWQKTRELVQNIYLLTSAFPDDERFGLTSQLRRAAVSVSSNIAEGSTRQSRRDKARFYEISYGSLIEVLNQLILAMDLAFLSKDQLVEVREMIEEVSRMLNALHRSAKD